MSWRCCAERGRVLTGWELPAWLTDWLTVFVCTVNGPILSHPLCAPSRPVAPRRHSFTGGGSGFLKKCHPEIYGRSSSSFLGSLLCCRVLSKPEEGWSLAKGKRILCKRKEIPVPYHHHHLLCLSLLAEKIIWRRHHHQQQQEEMERNPLHATATELVLVVSRRRSGEGRERPTRGWGGVHWKILTKVLTELKKYSWQIYYVQGCLKFELCLEIDEIFLASSSFSARRLDGRTEEHFPPFFVFPSEDEKRTSRLVIGEPPPGQGRERKDPLNSWDASAAELGSSNHHYHGHHRSRSFVLQKTHTNTYLPRPYPWLDMEKAVRRCWSGRISVGLLVGWMIMIERCCWLGWMRSRRRRAEQGSEWAGDVSQSDVWAKFMGDFLFVGFTPRLFAGKQSGVYSGSSGWRGGEWRAMRNFRGGDLNELMDSWLVGVGW